MLSFSAYEIHNRVRKQNWKLVMITLNVIPNTLQMFTVRNVNQNRRKSLLLKKQKILEPVCCNKQQKKVPGQLLVCGIGNL